MSAIPSDIADFIQQHKAATVCCLTETGSPYCFTCYYAFMPEQGWLVYKSGFGTQHEQCLKKQPAVSGTIVPEEIIVSTIRGIQYQGAQFAASFEQMMQANTAYYLRFPFAMAVPGNVFIIRLDWVKFTDNTISFGHKSHWSRAS